ncbi:serine/threonine protein kinase [Pleurocapsales cyanobacterium LEGE 06147]|nr:serine/threonine protein kinase [Pleurocapsales cyanobacterium LEGE 06147]
MRTALLNNRYRILETLGRGGFGETFLAEDTHLPSGRKCVIKQLKPIVEQPRIPLWMQERFQREAAILEELGEGHPQIPRLYAYFSETEKFYLVQEWIEGLTLAQKWERDGNLDPQQVKQILVQILPVLSYVHNRRIVHRDIKPENIILRYGGAAAPAERDRLPVLIDFGAVKEAMATVVNNSSSSTFSAAIGTPGYMPSEQAAGRPVYSSDLYSLGLTAIFLLTGKSPQDLETDPRTGEIIWQQHASNLDSGLISVLDRAIRFHPRDRFASAKEMLAALHSSTEIRNVTSATLAVAPGGKTSDSNSVPVRKKSNTVAVDFDSPKPKKKGNGLLNLFLFLSLAAGLSVGAFIAGFNLLSNLWRSRPLPTPQAKVEQPNSPSIFFPRREIPEETTKPDLELEATTEPEKTNESEATEEPEPPELIVETKPEATASAEIESESQPQAEINGPIPTTGTSESQLVSTLGEPTSQRTDGGENRTLIYQDIGPEGANLSYTTDRKGKIRQADIALAQSVSLGEMQQTLAELIGSEPPADIKNRLRQVYSRETDLSFFRVGKLEGKVQRDSKDRVNISVWEK